MDAPVPVHSFAQRWRDRREYRRPPSERIDPTEFGVEILRDRDAKAFVTGHHYSGSYPAARLAVGLMRRNGVGASRLVGVCVFGVPMNERSVPRYIGVEPNNGVELSRLVLLDEVLADGESWFVARALAALRAEKPEIAGVVMMIAKRAAVAYLLIAAADYLWQRHRHEKSLKMDKEEIKQEFKQQQLPAEIKSAQRRRAMELSRARMMDAVPTADVIVTNPTHYSVALKYDSGSPAPVVVAKGVDNLAFKIREVGRQAGVMIVPDPPLARTLYANVELGRQIPEELFHAVAQLLAYVYRVAGARSALAA